MSQSNWLEPSDDTIAALQHAVVQAREARRRAPWPRRPAYPVEAALLVADFRPADSVDQHMLASLAHSDGAARFSSTDWLELAAWALQAYEAARAKEGT